MPDGEPCAGDQPQPVQSFGEDRRAGFTDLESLSTLASRFVDAALWAALVDSVRELFSPTANARPAIAAVLSEDPLLGLAAAATFAHRDMHVPVFGQRVRKERLLDVVGMHYHLRTYVRDCRSMPERDTPSLMLAWNTPNVLASLGAVTKDMDTVAALKGGIICLGDRRKNHGTALPDGVVLMDLSDAALQVVAGAVTRLSLPGLEDLDQEGAEELVSEMCKEKDLSLEKVVASLNTPSQGYFLRFAQRLKSLAWPDVVETFDRLVMSPSENQPRHSASLFLVAHFSHLTPRQFIELGDALASRTPVSRPSRDQAVEPDRLTDHVLADCNIAFVRTAQGDAFATIVPGGPRQRGDEHGGGPERAEHLRWLFETKAPLLRERYLQYLGDSLLLGHPSHRIAYEYIQHEAQALREAAASDEPFTLAERLRRAVYGDASALGAKAAGELETQQEAAKRIEVFLRALHRVPALLDEFVGQAPDIRLIEAVRTLCSDDPSRPGFVSDEESRFGSAFLFWMLYARYPGKVRLTDYPSLGQARSNDEAWRADCLHALRAFLEPAEHGEERGDHQLFERPELLVRLIGDILQQEDRIVDSTPEACRSGLLAESWSAYLRKNLYGVAWQDTVDWSETWLALDKAASTTSAQPCDLLLAKMLLSSRRSSIATWIRRSRFRGLPASDSVEDMESARALFQLATLIIDALVGCAAFDEFEVVALDVWLLKAMKLPEDQWAHVNFGDSRFWLGFCGYSTPDFDESVHRVFRDAIDRVFALFPVVALMAATRRQTGHSTSPHEFILSTALATWLTEIPRDSKDAAAHALLNRIDMCNDFRKAWLDAHDQLRLKRVDWAAIRQSMAERTSALKAFADAVRPLASSSRSNRPEAKQGTLSSLTPAAAKPFAT